MLSTAKPLGAPLAPRHSIYSSMLRYHDSSGAPEKNLSNDWGYGIICAAAVVLSLSEGMVHRFWREIYLRPAAGEIKPLSVPCLVQDLTGHINTDSTNSMTGASVPLLVNLP